MNKSLTLITGSEATRKSLVKQLLEIIPQIDITSYAFDDGIDKPVQGELIVVSSNTLKKEMEEKGYLKENCNMIVANRAINYDKIEELFQLPEGEKVLLVNDEEETTMECIENLKSLEINHINLYPYYPGIGKEYKGITVAITPGEVSKVPSYIKKVYNILPRGIDLFTITKIIYSLEIFEEQYEEVTYRYLHKIVNLTKKLSKATSSLKDINFYLSTIIDGVNKGFILYDDEGNIKVFNDELNRILNIKQKFIVNNNINNIIRNKSLLEFLKDDSRTSNNNLKYYDTVLSVKKIIIDMYGLNLGIIEYSSESKTITGNLLDKGLIGKYEFHDIIGASKAITKVKNIGAKLAKSDLTVLIEGESGTGKELFASAIHNASERSEGPFLAVNFSAIPEELMESELFGYEEGAFTGAKKGGKKGLFEVADGGTIFLDEIGDISMRLQSRLLRVLQEKEIMRVGGSTIKKINVRIIAATNRDLLDMINKKEFRSDLYYRLKMGYIYIPPLRSRMEDIKELAEYFIACETTRKIILEEPVMKRLMKCQWLGNIRELRNSISYMVAMGNSDRISEEDIPGYIMKDKEILRVKDEQEASTKLKIPLGFNESELDFILKIIFKYNNNGSIIGRDIIASEGRVSGVPMTISRIRKNMEELERMGLILKSKGKAGSRITDEGRNYLKTIR